MHDNTQMTEIDVTAISMPEARKAKKFDRNDEKNRLFKENIEKVGLINPVDVRPISDGRYELVCGERRLWAIKQLGFKTILARVGDWTEKQIGFMRQAENVHRRHLSATELTRAYQELMKEFEEAFGPVNPGRRASGVAGANARWGKQAAAPGETPDAGSSMLTDPGSVSIEQPDSTTQPLKSFGTLLGESTGQHPRHTREWTQIAQAFTKEQLDVLELCPHVDVTKGELLKIAKIEDPILRGQVVSLVAAGSDVEPAIQEVVTAPPPEMQAGTRELREDSLTDKDWLDLHCGKLREMIQDPRRFLQDALLYRHSKKNRATLRADHKKEMMAIRQERKIGPFAAVMARVIWIDHPSTWLRCVCCDGNNLDRPECDGCYGAGYKINVKYPQQKKTRG